MTKIHHPDGHIMTARELANWANAVDCMAGGRGNPFTESFFLSKGRLSGDLCCCGYDKTDLAHYSLGEFDLLPLSDESIRTGGKAYMVCRACGSLSHL